MNRFLKTIIKIVSILLIFNSCQPSNKMLQKYNEYKSFSDIELKSEMAKYLKKMKPLCKSLQDMKKELQTNSSISNTFPIAPSPPMTNDKSVLKQYKKDLKQHNRDIKSFYKNIPIKQKNNLAKQNKMQTISIRLTGYRQEYILAKNAFIKTSGVVPYNEFIESVGLSWGLGFCW